MNILALEIPILMGTAIYKFGLKRIYLFLNMPTNRASVFLNVRLSHQIRVIFTDLVLLFIRNGFRVRLLSGGHNY